MTLDDAQQRRTTSTLLSSASLLDILSEYERVMQAHSARWTRENTRTTNTVCEWCRWYARTYGEELTTRHVCDDERARRSVIAFRAHCQKWGARDTYRRKREHIRRFLRWCIHARHISHDPFADVVPTEKRVALRKPRRRDRRDARA
jgi:hypothetical protein